MAGYNKYRGYVLRAQVNLGVCVWLRTVRTVVFGLPLHGERKCTAGGYVFF